MPENISHSVSYTQTFSTVENRWIKTVQEEQALSEAATVAEVARLIDQLYGLDACTQGLSGGGEAADETNTPAEETFDYAAAAFMGNICESDEHWTAHILVMVSHPLLPERPVLQTESAEIVATEPVQRRVSETVELSSGQSSFDLAWPYAGGLSVNLPDGITASVKGSTLNLSRPLPATRHLRLSYQTSYQRVSLQVPVEQASPAPDTSIARGTPQEAALIAFWGNLASLCAPEPPERDESSQTAIDKLCSRRYSGHTKDKECTRTVEYYKRCKCSGTEALGESRQEQEDCSCGKRSPGSHLGLERRLEGYTDCEGEDDEDLTDPEYYKEQCCKPPQGRLPTCSEEREEYKGGEGIEGGTAYYRALYGANVRMEAVTPEGGSCGEKIRQWIVEPLDCCAEVEQPLQADSGNPIKVNKGDRITLRVQGGRRALPGQEDHPLEWAAVGGLVFEKTGTAFLSEGTAEEVLIAQENICHQPTVVVDDGCKPVTLQFEGVDEEIATLSARSLAIEPETTFQISVVEHGVAPFFWYCNDQGVELVSQTEDGTSALFRAGAVNEWCVATVHCNDVCGKTVTCDILNAQTGKWVKFREDEFDFDKYDPPDRYAGGWPIASLRALYAENGPIYRPAYRPIYIAPGLSLKTNQYGYTTDEEYAVHYVGYSVPINGRVYKIFHCSDSVYYSSHAPKWTQIDDSHGGKSRVVGGKCAETSIGCVGGKANNYILDHEWIIKKCKRPVVYDPKGRPTYNPQLRVSWREGCGCEWSHYDKSTKIRTINVYSHTEYVFLFYEWICKK